MVPIIRADRLGKRYQLHERHASYTTFRDVLAETVRRPFSRWRRSHGKELWALRDVSFDVLPGTVIGIIGGNGAGKSTLLKVLSRVTPPTVGRAELRGRIASLLEIGTGFHSELSGRRNVYLNGAILGMKRREIQRQFDAIVAFAELEQFVDTPIKYYSTGMYLRLAFAVAAHLDAEIVAMDEVLAVGDIAFQQKCLMKMNEIATDGRTVLLVSHNMAAIRSLCHEVLLFERGRLVARGGPTPVVQEFVDRMGGREGTAATSILTTV